MSLAGNCPLCEAVIVPLGEVGESEILMCPECQSELIVEMVYDSSLILNEATEIEEYLGE